MSQLELIVLPKTPVVISASRRTDFPAFYLPKLIKCLEQGFIDVSNPYPGNTQPPKRVILNPADANPIVFWSKNYGTFLKLRTYFKDYELFFHFSITGCSELEPHVPALGTTLRQTAQLIDIYGLERLFWRFDPIVHWEQARVIQTNADRFDEIAKQMARLGVKRCFFSFVDWFDKVKRRWKKLGLVWRELGLEERVSLSQQLAQVADFYGIVMLACTQDPAFRQIPNIQEARCIDADYFRLITGLPCNRRRDSGQRSWCTCTKSVDIGAYEECALSCLYCYANPRLDYTKPWHAQ